MLPVTTLLRGTAWQAYSSSGLSGIALSKMVVSVAGQKAGTRASTPLAKRWRSGGWKTRPQKSESGSRDFSVDVACWLIHSARFGTCKTCDLRDLSEAIERLEGK